jgi:NO-binding membrane sensor protein with MHYT domain
MVGTYNPLLVLLSIIVAIFVSYTALSLAARVARAKDGSDNTGLWVAGGAIAMGCGIWSMHFIGMLALSLPVPLTYDVGLTIASLVIAIAISGFALTVASSPEINLVQLSVAALILGAGISGMHYSGMAAIDLLPQITYEPTLLVASIVIAVAASFAALWLFFQLRHAETRIMKLARVGAAFAMGFAISGMHYTGMAASRFSPKSFCPGTSNIDAGSLAVTTGVVAFIVLSITTLFLVLDARRNAAASAARATSSGAPRSR